MGIFDGIIGAGISGIGGVVSNVMNADQADKNREFQADMSNTAYQRGMKDMKAAGLNPILAYQKGPASSPTGASAVATNVGESMVSGYNTARRVEADAPNTEARTALTGVQEAKTAIDTDLARQQVLNAAATNQNIRANTALALEQAKSVSTTTEGNASTNTAKKIDSDFYKSWWGTGSRWIGNTAKELSAPIKGILK